MPPRLSRSICILSAMVNSGCLASFWRIATITRLNIFEPRSMTSRCPEVIGSNEPGYIATTSSLGCVIEMGRDNAGPEKPNRTPTLILADGPRFGTRFASQRWLCERRIMSTRRNNGSHYENHQRAAELQDAAAHAHRVAELTKDHTDHATPTELSRMERERAQEEHAGDSALHTFGH